MTPQQYVEFWQTDLEPMETVATVVVATLLAGGLLRLLALLVNPENK